MLLHQCGELFIKQIFLYEDLFFLKEKNNAIPTSRKPKLSLPTSYSLHCYLNIAIHCHFALPDVLFCPKNFGTTCFKLIEIQIPLFNGVQLMISTTI